MTARRSSDGGGADEPLYAGPDDNPDQYELHVRVTPRGGSQGLVYLARHKVGRRWRTCALKVRHRDRAEPSDVSEAVARRWISQSVDAANCEHPGLVRVLDAFVGHPPHLRGERPPSTRPRGKTSGEGRVRNADLYFVTKWQPGLVLHAWRHSRRSILGAALDRLGLAGPARKLRALRHPPARVLLRPIVQVGGGLDRLHEYGLVHGDVKPSNIIVHWQRGVLVDYGSLLRISRRPIAITRDYAPPREFQGQVAGDLFSLACVAFFLISGQSPTVNGVPGSGPNVSGMLRALERNPLVGKNHSFHRLMRDALRPSGDTVGPGDVGDWASALHAATAGWAAPLEIVRTTWSSWPLRRLGRRLSGALPRPQRVPPRPVWIAIVALAVAAWLALVAGVERFALAGGSTAILLWWLLRGPRSRRVLVAGAFVLVALVGAVVRVASWVEDVPPAPPPGGDSQTTDDTRSTSGVETSFQSGATALPGPVLLSEAALDGPGESALRDLTPSWGGLTFGVERYAYTGSADGLTVSVELTVSNRGDAIASMDADSAPPTFVLLVAGSVNEPWRQAQVPSGVAGYRAKGGLRLAPIQNADVLAVPPARGSGALPYGAEPAERWETAWNDAPLAVGGRRGGRADTDDRLSFSVPAPDEGAIRLMGIAYLTRDGYPQIFLSSDRWGREGDPYTYQIVGDAVHEDDLRPGECVAEPINGNPYRSVVPC